MCVLHGKDKGGGRGNNTINSQVSPNKTKNLGGFHERNELCEEWKSQQCWRI